MFTEVIIPMSITEEHSNSSLNIPAINAVSAVDGKHLLIEVDMAPIPTRGGHSFLFKYNTAKIS